jgi:alpha-beta hydrolase superfamily lysophospholipase
MDRVTSADGTDIAYERVGSGPTVVLVGGAFCDHTATEELAGALAGEFTAVSYDRRGRGESGDTAPYDPAREFEDLSALITAVGGPAFVYGISSGAVLCLRAAAHGVPVAAVAALEPPFRASADAPPVPERYTETLVELTSTGRRGDAVAYFMTEAVGQPPEAVEQARRMPMWPGLEAMAHTLAYDSLVLGRADGRVPVEELARVTAPVLGVYSTASPAWLVAGAEAATKAVPTGEVVGLPGGFHQVPAATLAPVLAEFFLRAR